MCSPRYCVDSIHIQVNLPTAHLYSVSIFRKWGGVCAYVWELPCSKEPLNRGKYLKISATKGGRVKLKKALTSLCKDFVIALWAIGSIQSKWIISLIVTSSFITWLTPGTYLSPDRENNGEKQWTQNAVHFSYNTTNNRPMVLQRQHQMLENGAQISEHFRTLNR